MKINWGTGIVLAFVAFITFILYFVVKMNTENRANHDLVTEDYYKAELGFEKEIDAETNAHKLANNLIIGRVSGGILIVFPKEHDPMEVKGTVYLYRPSNKKLDFVLPLELTDSRLLIPHERLLEGRWNIKVAWRYDGLDYLRKESITY